jgi:carbon-monoxide dehydrogenase medium subunit
VRRRLPLGEFFTGPGRTVLRPGELLVGVHVPEPPARSGSAFLKLGRVTLDMAKVSVSVFLERDGRKVRAARIAVGGAAPTPVRAREAEQALAGAAFGSAAVERAAGKVQAAITPISDVRSTADYRRRMAGVLLGDALRAAWRRAGGEAEA